MPKDEQKGRSKPGLKIVDETSEITRLERPSDSAAPPQKKTSLRRSQENFSLLGNPGEVAPNPVTASASGGPSLPEKEPVAPLKIPPIFFYLVAGGFVLLLGLGIFMALGGRHPDNRNQFLEQARENIQHTKEEEIEAKKMVQVLSEALVKYSSATSIEEKLAFARQPDRVEPLMREYYADHEMKPLKGATLISQLALPLETRSFVILTSSFEDAENKIFLAEVDNDLSVHIDWESDVCYQPVDLEDYVRERPSDSGSLRVYAQPDNYYVYEFADTEKYQCLKLTFRDSDEYLFGYLVKDSPVGTELLNYFLQNRRLGISKPEPMMLQLRFLENSKAERGVLIEDLISTRWANIDEFDDED